MNVGTYSVYDYQHKIIVSPGAKIDNLLDFMEEEKMLDPFLLWLGWFTDKGEKEVEEEDKKEEEGDQRREPEDGDGSKQDVLDYEESFEKELEEQLGEEGFNGDSLIPNMPEGHN